LLGLPSFRAQRERLVVRYELHSGLFQAVLDLSCDVGPPGDPVDRLADHDVEPPSGPFGFCQQVGNTAITGHGDLELLVRVPRVPRLST
jgi:hypothetical protein